MNTTAAVTPVVVDRIADLLHDAIGLRPETTMRGRILRTVRDQAEAQGLAPQGYLEAVLRNGDAFQELLNGVTVQESGFFRHPEHFEVMLAEVLPGLPSPVTIWSAGCANGQEPFSLAMLLEEAAIDGSVIATDLSTTALQRTVTGKYATREIGGLSPERRARYLTGSDRDGWQVDAALLRRVTVVQHNVLDPLPPQVRGAQVVFCRNLLIYLSAEHSRTFLNRLADAYPTGTTLFVGAAEVLLLMTDRFDTVRSGGTFRYRRRDVRRAASAPTPVKTAQPAGPQLRAGASEPVRPPARIAPAAAPQLGPHRPEVAEDAGAAAKRLTLAGQLATAERSHQSAVVAFRACAYLTPEDPIAHLHLGLALEAAGDQLAAQKAFGVASRTWLAADPAVVEAASEGFSFAELGRLLAAKQAAP